MCNFDSIPILCNNFIFFFNVLVFLIIATTHLVFFFLIKKSDFDNLFDALDSSPLFEFTVQSQNCDYPKSRLIFHVWEGRKETAYSGRRHRSRTIIVDKTNIDKIYGNYFCYNHISYKTLLYNGQIIKKEENCGDKYPKDCGIIDTLNQHLCIGDNDNCPLYDVGIGDENDFNSSIYDYNDNAGVYYNKNNYNESDKKIIGKIILNDGQPCYKLNEKLWRKFDSDEAGDEHLKCDLEIFGEITDKRYDEKGKIKYQKLYEDNLSPTNYDLVKDDIGNEYVSLYSREFLGIDKTCDEKNKINKKDYEKLKDNQNMERICILVESITTLCILIPIIILCSILYGTMKDCDLIKTIGFFFLIFGLVGVIPFIICQAVFLGRIISYDLSYNCSDDKTNEVLRIENENTKTTIIYTAINLGLNIFVFLVDICAIIINYLIDKFDLFPKNNTDNIIKNDINEKNYDNSAQNQFKSGPISDFSGREVNINIGTPKEKQQFNNKINNNTPGQVNDLGVPPQLEQGVSSNTKF